MKNYYDILGLEYNAESSSINSAYRKLSKKFHPDLNPNDKFFEKMFKDINEANEVLSDRSSKEKYDKILALYSNRYQNVDKTLEDIERQIKKEFEEILKQKEEEIKKKFWNYDQHKQEEERIKRKNDEEIQRAQRNKLSKEIESLTNEKLNIEKLNKDYRLKIEKANKRILNISNRISEINSILNPDKIKFATNSKNYENRDYNFNINQEPTIKKSLDSIKTNIDLRKREIFIKQLLNFCKSKSMSAKFAAENSDLKDQILNSTFNNGEFNRIYRILGSQNEKIEKFEKEIFNYIS